MNFCEHVAEKRKFFDRYLPPVTTPLEVSKRFIDYGRQTGKTTLLVEALEFPCAIVVHSGTYGRELAELIASQRRVERNQIKIVEYRRNGDKQWYTAIDQLRGHSNLRVYVDNGVWDMILADEMEKAHIYFDFMYGARK